MKTLITGATGFVGRGIVEAFGADGHAVRLTSRNPERHLSQTFLNLPAPDAPDKAFDGLMDGIDHVVHCAALNNDAGGATEEDFRRANVLLTQRLARAASKRINGRFIYISSSHAINASDVGVKDEGRAQRATAYARTKREGELATLECFAHLPNRASALRLPPVYGVGMRNRLAQLLKIAKLPMPLPITGLEKRHFIISRDAVASAVLHMVFRSEQLQPIYFASDASAVSAPEIIKAFRQGLGSCMPTFRLPGSRAVERIVTTRRQRTVNAPSQNSDLLVSEGWRPEELTLDRLRELAKSSG